MRRAFPYLTLLGFFAAGLAACAGPSQVQPLPDGSFAIDCSGGYHNWSGCHTAAGRQCADGYAILSQVSNEGSGVGVRDWSRQGSEVSRTMIVRCH